MQLRSVHLDFAGGQLGIGFLPLYDVAFDRNDEFAARVLGLGVRFGLRFLVEDYLHDSGAIAHIEEQQIAEVAAPRYPTENDGESPTRCDSLSVMLIKRKADSLLRSERQFPFSVSREKIAGIRAVLAQ